MKRNYLLEARGHPGHNVIRNYYESKGLKDGVIYLNNNFNYEPIREDKWGINKVKDKDGNFFEQEGWQGGDGKKTLNLKQIIQLTYVQMLGKFTILRTSGHKFTPGVATMWTRGEFGKTFNDNTKTDINTFNSILELLVKYHKNEYNGFLMNTENGDKDVPTAEELIERFSQARAEDIQATKDRINSKEYTNNKYFIRPITEYEDLLRYKELCYPKNVWCLMNQINAWRNYTSNGLYQFYLVLDKRLCNENGDPILENKDVIPAEQGKGHPNDEYGLSMMGIIVDSTGELAYCTSRWNHAGGGTDHTMNAEEISNTLGVNFYQTFKPNRVFQDKIDKAMDIYKEKGSLTGFDDYQENIEKLFTVKILKKYNVLNTETNKLISKKWFDNIGYFYEGFALVGTKDKKFNFININGQIISDIWFDDVSDFNDGYAAVSIKSKGWNWIDKNGKLLSKEWFKKVGDFGNGFAPVKLNDKGWNFINVNGEILSKKDFRYASSFINNFAVVKVINGGENVLNTNGELICDTCYDFIEDFNNGFARVEKDNLFNFINTNGELISDNWFENSSNFKNGLAKVYNSDNGWNYINTNCEFEFDHADYIGFDITLVEKGDKCNFINKNNELLSSIWFDQLDIILKNYLIVYLDNSEYILSFKGDLFDNTHNFLKNVSPRKNNETNEEIKRLKNKFINEVLNLNKRIKKLYE